MKKTIPTNIINLKNRTDRKEHILSEFVDKGIFDLNLYSFEAHSCGAIGLWMNFRSIVRIAKEKELEFVLICEDDHKFTSDFNQKKLIESIKIVDKLEGDILLGGVSHFFDAVQYSNDIFWISEFSGLQFTILYRRFYDTLLSIKMEPHENLDLLLGKYSDNIYCLYPFMSTQKTFGYSDVTPKNNNNEVVKEYFENASRRLDTLIRLKQHYDKLTTK